MPLITETIHLGCTPDGAPITGRAIVHRPPPDRRAIPERMADDLMTAYEADGKVLEADIARAGWTAEDIARHGRQACSILRRRLAGRRIETGA